MLMRAVGGLLTVVGLTVVLVGVMLMVLLGRDSAWTARTQVPAGGSAVLVEPALASVLGPQVSVTARGDDGTPMLLGRARADDAAAYVSGTPHTTSRSLTDSRTLRLVRAVGGASLPAPESVDIFEQTSTAGTLTWRPTRGARSVVVTAPGGGPLPAVDLGVTWQDGTWRWWPAGAVGAGAAVLAVGQGLLWSAARSARGRRPTEVGG